MTSRPEAGPWRSRGSDACNRLNEWRAINRALTENPPLPRYAAQLAQFAKVGIGPGDKLDKAARRGFARAAVDGRTMVLASGYSGYGRKRVSSWVARPVHLGNLADVEDLLRQARSGSSQVARTRHACRARDISSVAQVTTGAGKTLPLSIGGGLGAAPAAYKSQRRKNQESMHAIREPDENPTGAGHGAASGTARPSSGRRNRSRIIGRRDAELA
jgi:hypothetical protein